MSAPRSALVLGGGHNGLVAGVQLARAGVEVTVVEQANEPGGCVWTERGPHGEVVERGAFEHGGILAMAEQLGLTSEELGDARLQYIEHPVAAGFCFGNGERRVFWSDLDRTVRGLRHDGPAYRRLSELADALFATLGTFTSAPTLTQVAAALGPLPGGDELFRLLLSPADVVLDVQLSDPYTRAALALQASHAQVPSWAPGSGMFAFLLPASHGGPAVRPVGGSRALIDALVAALEAAGGELRTGTAVTSLKSASPSRPLEKRGGGFGGALASVRRPSKSAAAHDDGAASVQLSDGTTLSVDAVVSSIGLPRTLDLLDGDAPAMQKAAAGLHSGHFNVAELTVTLIADEPFDLPFADRLAIWYAIDRPEDLRQGFAEIMAGELPRSPWSMVAEVQQPEGAPGGVLWLSSVVPLRRSDGPWTKDLEQIAADKLIDHVAKVLDLDLRAQLSQVRVAGPVTWAERIGGDGNPNHLDNTIDQLFGWRTPGHADGRTELGWLVLAGAGQHPGGGLSGLSGAAAADALLRAEGPHWRERLGREVSGLRQSLRAYRSMRKGM